MNQRIDLSPEELQQLAGEFNKASQNGHDILTQLKTMIDQSEGQWEGERQREFLGRMNDSMTNIGHYLRGLQETSTSLQQTAAFSRNGSVTLGLIRFFHFLICRTDLYNSGYLRSSSAANVSSS